MDQPQPQAEPSNVQVVAGGAALAGLIAGLLVAAARREEPPPMRERIVADGIEPAITIAADRARAFGRRLSEAMPENPERLEAQARVAVSAARRRAGNLATAVDRDALAGVGATLDRLGRRAGKAAERGAERSTKKGHVVRKQASKRARLASKQAREASKHARQATDETLSTAQAVAAQTAAAAIAQAEKARDFGIDLAANVRERLPEVSQKVGEEIVPSVQTAVRRTAASGVDLWQAARERATEAVPSIDLGRGRDEVARSADVFGRGSNRVREATGTVADQASQIGHRVRTAPGRAVNATASATKDGGAALLWGGAAASLVYYALLTPERREQVLQTARTAGEQLQEVIRDFRGYDDEF